MDLSIYVHIPYCVSKCHYCNFVSFQKKEDTFLDYIKRLESELDKFEKKEYVVKTIYFGGGTPSHFDEKLIVRIMNKIKSSFKCDLQEVTIEVNPNSVSEEKLITYKEAGINRISIGVQSLNNESLKFVNRPHTAEQAVDTIKLVKKYFDNVSGDIIINLPFSKDNDEVLAAKTMLDLGVKHISAYGLQIEKGTKLYSMYKKDKSLLDEDKSADRYERLFTYLRTRKTNRYEISNFSKEGYESKHNLAYWNRSDYLGIGCAAHSLIKGVRFNNTEVLEDYIKGKGIHINKIKLDNSDIIEETIMLSLRTKFGLDLNYLKDNLGYDILKEKAKEVNDHLKLDNIKIEKGKMYITDRGQYISNSIIVDFM